MKPTDLGLPARFTEFRQYPGFDQFQTALELATAHERFQLFNAPTGVGKSPTYATVAALGQCRWLALVGTKGLQSQVLGEELVQRSVYGHRNYMCASRTSLVSIDDADSDDIEYQCSVPRDRCIYLGDVAAAATAHSVVTNYAYWLSIGKYSDPALLGEFGLLVLDEAHTAADWLTRSVAVTISRYRLRKVLDLNTLPTIPNYREVTDYDDWSAEWLDIARTRRVEIGVEDRSAQRRIERLIRDLDMVYKVSRPHFHKEFQWREPWIVITDSHTHTTNPNTIHFTPRWGSDFAEQYLFRNIPRVLLTSATITPQHAHYLGIPDRDMKYREVPSPFDPRRRPIIWVPTCRVDHRMSDEAKWLLRERVDEVIEAAIDQRAGNGVIHTGSYARNQEIVAGSRYRAAIITHQQNSADFQRALERFKHAGRRGEFAIMASPRMQEGIDLPDDEARWAMVLKVPFPDSRDPLTKLRARDSDYRMLVVMELIQQMCGRLIRGVGDFGVTWVLDSHWGDYVRWKYPWPETFESAFRTLDSAEGYRFLTHAIVDTLPPLVIAPVRTVELILPGPLPPLGST